MPPDQHVNPAEEPSSTSSPTRPWVLAAVGTTFPPGVPTEPDITWISNSRRSGQIGRRPDNDIVISDLGVSKQHAGCACVDGRPLLHHRPGQPRQAQCVNGTRVSQQELDEGDIIAIGRATFPRLVGGPSG